MKPLTNKEIFDELTKMKLPAHVAGFAYALDAVKFASDDIIKGIRPRMCYIYRQVAKCHVDATNVRVERALRFMKELVKFDGTVGAFIYNIAYKLLFAEGR